MAGRKYDCTVKAYDVRGSKIETQGSRALGLRAVYLQMPLAERAQVRALLDGIDAKEKEGAGHG